MNIKLLIDTYKYYIIIFFLVLTLFKSCSISSDLDNHRKQSKKTIDSISFILSEVRDSIPTKEFIVRSNNTLLYDFLVYEDDIDKKKITFSDIKLRLK
jgi:hypothetical protein